ncbi:hypothetical protein [Actinomadura rubrisoli]|uniref:Uncharacterized protein n=1 Tax=Actinomadura rubrisoli TaxID=2530368 RepID=A0A4R5ATD6_9ACTN|nr:hypothetical protein [Actinomadura rubrisoli]TDD76528.1 hypothetical protein E1298_30765 [Actinomadura rubrisoli]
MPWTMERRLDGLARASVRNVAREALLRRLGQLAFALCVVVERIERWISALDVRTIRAERRAGNEVWLAFTVRFLVDVPGVARAGVRHLLGVQGVELGAERLHALVVGRGHASRGGRAAP